MSETSWPGFESTNRARSILRATAGGRVEMCCSCEPDLFIDGLHCCDQLTAHALVHAGLIRQARPGLVGSRVPARITSAGLAALAEHPEAA